MYSYSEVLKRIGRNIRIERIKLGYSQEKFAEIVGVHTNYIGKIERGEQNLTIKKLVEILSYINTDIEEIAKRSWYS